MRQPGTDAQGIRAIRVGAGTQDRGPADEAASATGAAAIPPPRRTQAADAQNARNGLRHRLPPGQYVQSNMPVLHYGPVPACNRSTWDLRVYGATAGGRRWDWDGFGSLPVTEIVADFHCVTKFSVLGVLWRGVPAAELLRAVPPAGAATHVMVWADYGYGANLPLEVLAADETLLATHRDDKELAPEQGYPVRLVVPSRYGWKNVKWVRAIEYMAGDRRGFWEERGYHNNADPWLEQRYSYQELPGEGPPL
jgi:DMSO/TMAO reductase YedYZ molybdopterin-dependent catalytic subunit